MASRSNLGRIRPYPKGAYSAAVEYVYFDMVTNDGSTYLYINTTKSTGTALSNTDYWQCLACRGTDGADGTNGRDGADGTNGRDGADGTNGRDGAYTDTYNALGEVSGNVTIARSNGNIQSLTPTAATVLTLTATDTGRILTLIITNGGAFTITWPTTIKWASGTAPTLTVSGIDVITLYTIDSGVTWLGIVNGQAFA